MPPYVLTIARPDCKRPSVDQTYGTHLDVMETKLNDIFYDYIYATDGQDSYEDHIRKYYDDSYMDQAPYKLYVFNVPLEKWVDESCIIVDIYNKALAEFFEDVPSSEGNSSSEENEEDSIS
jgi:hypothetical protein